MYNCLKMPTSRFRKLLASLFVFAGLCMSAQAADYTWTGAVDNDWNNAANWNPSTAVPGAADTVILNNTVNITLSDNVVIGNLFIYTGNTNTVTLNLNGKELNINTRLRLGKDTTGQLVLEGGSLSTTEFDTNDNGNNSIYLDNTDLSISTSLLVNGTGTTTIDGTGSSSFTIPASYDTAYGTGNTLSFTGSIQPTVASGTYTITSSGVPAPGATITITISNQTSDTPPVPVDFTDITFKATFTGTEETYKVNGTAITNAATTISNSPAASTMTITVELPESIEPRHGISLALYEGTTTANLLGTPLFYTQQSENTSWTGSAGDSDWNNILNWTNGIPAKNMNAIIPGGVSSYPNLTSDISAINLKSVNLNATGSELTIGAGGKIQTGSLINKGTLSNTGTISTGDFTNNTAIINAGNISITKDLTSTANITGTGTLLFTGTIDQIFTSNNKTYTNIIENKNGGNLTVSGNCSIDSFTITKGTATTFSGTPEITSWSDVAGAGNLSFADGATLSSDTEIKTSSTVNLTGTFTTADLTVTNGTATLNGTFSSDSLTFTKAVTLAGNTTITSSAASETVHFADAITGASNSLTINTGATQFDGAVSGLSSLSTAAATINCASITSSGVQTYNGAITISQNTILSASEIDFLATIGSSNKLTVNAPVFKSAASADNTITLSEIEFAANTSIQTNTKRLTFDVTTISGTGKTISLSSGSKADLKAGSIVSPAVSNAGTITCIGAVTFNDAVVNTNGAITCNGAAIFKGAYSGSGASLILSSGTSLFESDLDLSGTTFSHSNGTVQIGGSAAGEVTIKGPQNFNNFETSRSLIIYGTNSFNDFTATNLGGKSLSFEAGKTQNINGNLSLSGSSSTSLLTLKDVGSGIWNINCSNPSITNVDVINSTSTNSIVATESKNSGHNTRWIFPGQEYIWTGNSSNDWDTAANWNLYSVPGFGAKVTIAAATNHPILTDALNLNQSYNGTAYTGEITVASGAKFDLADETLTVGTIINNGTVQLKGVANQITLPCTISNGTEVSTVEYYDSTSVLDSTKLVWGTTYKNLIINKPASLDDVALSVSNTTTIKPETGKNVSLNNPANSFGGAITLDAGAVILNSSSDITIAANALADSLSVTCADGKTININKITTTGAQTFDGAVTVASNTTLTAGSTSLIYFKKTVTGSNPLTISTANSQFDGLVSNLTSLTTAATTTFNANITGFGALSTAAANINCESVSTSGAQTYTGTVSVQTTTAFISGAGQLINFQDTVTGSGSPLPQVTIQNANSKFDGTVSDLTSLTTAASASFNANISSLETLTTNAASINCTSISTSGNQNYNGAVTLGANTVLTSNGGNLLFGASLNGAHQIEFSVPATSGSITVSGQVGNNTPPSIVLTQAGTTTFNNIVSISSFTDTTTSGSITFKAGGTISSATTFTTPQTVTFGDDASDIFTFGNSTSYANLSHTAGNTSITGTLNAANISLGTSSGTSTLNGTINGSQVSVGTLNAQGNIISSGSQTFNGTVTLTDNLSLASNATSAGGINFTSTINGAHNLSISTNAGTNGTSFNGAVGSSTALATLAVTGPSTFNCTSITSTGNQTFDGTVTVQSDTSLTANAGQLINFKNTLTGSGTPLPALTVQTSDSQFDGAISSFTSLTTAATTSFNANLSSVGTLTTNAANINCASISTSSSQTYNSAVALGVNTVLTSSSGNLIFGSSLNGAHQIEFSVPTTTGSITVNGQVGETNPPSLVLNQAGTTTFNGVVNISSFTDTTTSGSITFNAGGTISSATTFTTPQPVTFGDAASDTITFGASPDYANLTHTSGNTVINGTVIGADITLGDTTGGPATITTPGVFLLADGKTLSYTTSFTQNGTGNSVLKGDFGSASGNGSAAFAHSVQLNASGASSFGTAGDSISITENLIITAPSAGLTINAPTTVNENIVMYTGAVTASANLTALNDILILGASYSETDTSTGITDEYSYTASRPTGWSTGNYNATQLPDRSPLPAVTNYSASLQTQPGITITVGKNFYANHTELKGVTAGQWLLKLPDLTNPANGYAEAYFTKVTDCKVICSDGSDDGSKARLITLEDTDTDAEKTTNTNVDFDDFKITSAFTVRDNAIRVEFNRPVRYHGATIDLLKFHTNTSSPSGNFTGLYSDPECQTSLDYDTQLSYFYIKAQPQDGATIGAWNTDASGKSAGAADEKSSDRHGMHHTSLPCLDFPRALSGMNFILTDRWGKRLNNYSQRVTLATAAEPAYGSQSSTFEVEDKTGPVLWTLRTGQELHTAYDTTNGEASQHSYDSHNFLEFRYSEQVDIGTHTASSVPEENIQVTDTLGAIQENISSSHNTLSFAGLSKINVTSGEGLKLFTGSNGNENKYVNALYRLDEYSVRLSIAGWTDGTITDYSGNEYKKWAGYIESATQFTGAAASAISTTNNQVVDLSGNPQIEYTNGFQIEPLVISNSSASNVSDLLPLEPDLYSVWDLSAPVFAPLRFSKENAWGDQEYSEAVGNTNGTGSTLDRIDFHFFDNTPTYTSSDEAEWFTEIGWCNPGSEASKENLKDSSYTYCSDIIGGIRQFDSDSTRRTTGGIRMSTKLEAGTSFKYNTNPDAVPDKNFSSGISNIFTTIISTLFTGSSDPRRPVNDPDGLYLGLRLSDLSLPIETTFAFSFNEGEGYITDLAGNRLRSKTSKTIDRSAPSFDITLSPINQKEVILVFVKEVVTDSSKIRFTDNNGNKISVTQDFLSLLPGCFQIISINEDGTFTPNQSLQIDSSIPAELISERTNSSFTAFRMTLTNPVTFDNIKNLYIQVKQHPDYPELSTDPFTSNTDSRVTLIQDKLGNYIGMYSAHALSDFAVGVVNPAYGYSPDMKFEEDYVMNGLYGQGTWAVHDWNADQQNYGTLPAGHPVTIVANTDDGTEEKLSLPENVRIYFSPNPQADSISTQLNKDLNIKLRVWLPLVTDGIIPALSSTNNENFKSVDSKLLNSNNNTEGLSFDIPLEDTKDWKTGNQISFLFGILNSNNEPFRIYSSPYYDIGTNRFNLSLSNSVPLYCLRMHNISDISTLDLWSFKIKSITEQRGGVTILNNVINPDKGEKTVVKVNQPVNGKLNVIVMTLDGNIVTYLNRGEALAGEHFFTWNGKNKAGNSVARGMYFVRVIGGDFDETRKVMVVK